MRMYTYNIIYAYSSRAVTHPNMTGDETRDGRDASSRV